MTCGSKPVVTLIVDDNTGHLRLIEKNLARAGLRTPILKFRDGQDVLDFLFCRGPGEHREQGTPYFLVLDIHMPLVDGVEVLRQLKADSVLRALPILMFTTTDDPEEVQRCHTIGCSNYIVKPTGYEPFAKAVAIISNLISVVESPQMPGIERPQPSVPE